MQPAAGQLLSYISLHDETQKGENSCLCVHGYSISIFLSARLMDVLTGSHSARFSASSHTTVHVAYSLVISLNVLPHKLH